MNRRGMSMVFRVLVVGVVLLALALILLGGFRGNYGPFDQYVGGNIQSGDINTCENNVQSYCQREGSGSWADRYPECQEHADAIESGNSAINEDGTCN